MKKFGKGLLKLDNILYVILLAAACVFFAISRFWMYLIFGGILLVLGIVAASLFKKRDFSFLTFIFFALIALIIHYFTHAMMDGTNLTIQMVLLNLKFFYYFSIALFVVFAILLIITKKAPKGVKVVVGLLQLICSILAFVVTGLTIASNFNLLLSAGFKYGITFATVVPGIYALLFIGLFFYSFNEKDKEPKQIKKE